MEQAYSMYDTCIHRGNQTNFNIRYKMQQQFAHSILLLTFEMQEQRDSNDIIMLTNTNKLTENLPGKISSKRRKVKLPRYSHLNKKTILYFDNFIESTSPLRLSNALRDLFLLHLSYDDAMPNNLSDLSADLYFLLQFLDRTGKEMQGKIQYE